MGRVTAEKSYEAAVLPRRCFIGQARRYFDRGICRDASVTNHKAIFADNETAYLNDGPDLCSRR
jgi:hypothetical protein